MGFNIGLYLQRSKGLVRKSEVLVWTFNQEGIKVEDSPIALIRM
jgi:hypothetical protein